MNRRLATLQQQYDTAIETHNAKEQQTSQALQTLQQLQDALAQKDNTIADVTSKLQQAVADRDAASS